MGGRASSIHPPCIRSCSLVGVFIKWCVLPIFVWFSGYGLMINGQIWIIQLQKQITGRRGRFLLKLEGIEFSLQTIIFYSLYLFNVMKCILHFAMLTVELMTFWVQSLTFWVYSLPFLDHRDWHFEFKVWHVDCWV